MLLILISSITRTLDFAPCEVIPIPEYRKSFPGFRNGDYEEWNGKWNGDGEWGMGVCIACFQKLMKFQQLLKTQVILILNFTRTHCDYLLMK